MAGAIAEKVGFSTGGTGIRPRSFERTYNNWGGLPMTDAGQFVETFNAGELQGPRHRRVLRALTTPDVASALVTSRAGELNGAVEYVAPVKTSSGDFFIVGAAQNGPERNGPGTQLQSQADLPRGTRPYSNEPRSLSALLDRSHGKGARFVSTLNSDTVFDEVGRLWKDTYGWTDDGLAELRERLGREADRDPAERSVFFVGAVDEQGVLAASMAEPLALALPGGGALTLWESTEWIADPNRQVNGHPAATVKLNEALIAAAHEKKGDVTIIAETNQRTPAGGAARSAGMRVPQVTFIGENQRAIQPPQVLKDNVGVNDGRSYDGPPMYWGGRAYPLRSFDLYQALPSSLAELASPANQAVVRRVLTRA